MHAMYNTVLFYSLGEGLEISDLLARKWLTTAIAKLNKSHASC